MSMLAKSRPRVPDRASWIGVHHGIFAIAYDAKDRRIWINEEEAERVRIIFRRYLEVGSLALLMGDLRQQGILIKLRTLKTGKTVGGIPFTRGGLSYLLHRRAKKMESSIVKSPSSAP